MRAILALGILLCSVSIAGCRTGQSVSLRTLPNFVAGQPALVFLDFLFKATDKPERSSVELINAIIGRGRMKDLPVFSNSNRQVEVVFKSASNQTLRTVQYDHPLYQIVEYPAEQGTLRLRGFSMQQANLSIRFASDPQIDRLELYSLVNNHRRKLYSLRLKP